MRRVLTACLTLALLVMLAVPVFAAEKTTKMVDMHQMEINCVETREEIKDSYGNLHRGNIYAFDARLHGYVRYELKGKYSAFSGTLVAADTTNSAASMSFAIFADGREVYSCAGFTRQMDGQPIKLDLTGVNVIEFLCLDRDHVRDAWIYMVDGVFTAAETPAPAYPEWVKLKDVVLVDSGCYGSTANLGTDLYGEMYYDYYNFEAWNSAFALYNLNRNYEVFSADIFPQRDAADEMKVNVVIYADEKEICRKEVATTSEAVHVELNVKNVKTLRIVTEPVDGGNNHRTVYVGNTKLAKHLHIPGEPVIDVEATCTEAGEQSIFCTDCSALIQTAPVPATGHTPETKWTVTKNPTCTEKGQEIRNCAVCGKQAEARAVDMLEHTPAQEWTVVREANCHVIGEKIRNCVDCSKELASEDIPTTEHSFGKWTTISGSVWNNPIVKERACEICGDKENREDNSTSWLKPLVAAVFLIIVGSVAVIVVTLRMNGLSISIYGVRRLFGKSVPTDATVERILEKDSIDKRNM